MPPDARALWPFLAALLLAVPPLAAQGVDDVEATLRRGVALRREGRDAEALALFEQAHGASGSPRTAAQLGLVQQALSRWLAAEALLRAALASTDDPWIARNRPALESAYRVTLQHVAEVEVSADVAGAELQVDGALVGVLPLREPLRLLAGTVSLELRAPGRAAVARRVAIEPGQRLHERFELATLPSPGAGVHLAEVTTSRPAEVPPVRPPSVGANTAPTEATSREAVAPGWWRSAGVGLGVLAGASLATGVTALALRQSAASAYNRECAPGDSAGTCGDRLETGHDLGVTSAVTLSLAGGLAVASIVLLALPQRAAPRRAARFTPWAGAVVGGGIEVPF